MPPVHASNSYFAIPHTAASPQPCTVANPIKAMEDSDHIENQVFVCQGCDNERVETRYLCFHCNLALCVGRCVGCALDSTPACADRPGVWSVWTPNGH